MGGVANTGGWIINVAGHDKIMEDQDSNNTSDIPKKYRRSLRKITILNQ
jgi:hypothetical protein